MNLDSDGPQYVTSNTLDELSHQVFLNAYLESKGAEPVNLDEFRTLQGSRAKGAQDIGRLTNLMELNVDTSWFTRYRSTANPDSGAKFPQAVTIKNRTAIPRTDADFEGVNHIQVIANTAAFHFGTIEQGGSSLYASLARRLVLLKCWRSCSVLGETRSRTFWNGLILPATGCNRLLHRSRPRASRFLIFSPKVHSSNPT